MKLLSFFLVVLYCDRVFSKSHVPFDAASAGAAYVDTATRNCHWNDTAAGNKFQAPTGKVDPFPQYAEYDTGCHLGNSFIVQGPVKFNDDQLPCDATFTCKGKETAKVCSGDVTTAKNGPDGRFFAENTACQDSGALSKGVVVLPRFSRAGQGQHVVTDGAYVRTLTVFEKEADWYLQGTRPNVFGVSFKWKSLGKPTTCSGCLESAYLMFTTIQMNRKFNVEIFPTKTCQWIFICFLFNSPVDADNPSSCNIHSEVQLFLKAGAVTTGIRKSAFVLDLESGRTIRLERSNATNGTIFLTTGSNERLIISAFNTKDVAIMMSDSKCLEHPIKNIDDLGMPHYIDPTPFDPKQPFVKPQIPNENKTEYIAPKVRPSETFLNVTPSVLPSDTTVPPLTGTPPPPTTTATQPAPHFDSARVVPGGVSASIRSSHEGWLTWAYFYGTLCSTTLAFIVIGVIFYCCRRTIYSNWYSAIYKRYGCDTLGTTGSVTGANFRATTASATTGTTTTEQVSTTGSTTTATLTAEEMPTDEMHNENKPHHDVKMQ